MSRTCAAQLERCHWSVCAPRACFTKSSSPRISAGDLCAVSQRLSNARRFALSESVGVGAALSAGVAAEGVKDTAEPVRVTGGGGEVEGDVSSASDDAAESLGRLRLRDVAMGVVTRSWRPAEGCQSLPS